MTEETLFDAALSLPEAERGAFLDRECSANKNLRARIEALLSAHDAPVVVLDRPRDAVPQPAPSDITAFVQPEMKPDVLIGGRYTLLEKLGEGGMGEVWVAKQTEPVKRRVALKLIKTGMDSKAVLGRFEQERQALGMMDHPNIAKVLDGGMTPTGQPFFVMELVNGFPLIKYCDDAKLTPRQRLELFVPICQAVQHAHQKGIVHRDLKPANILVTEVDGNPVPKVIDFGVAKATAGKLSDDSLLTQFGSVVGTLEYMSPEQAGLSGEDIDTRADIYSLGVILYELLTGLKPIDAKRLKNTALLEMIRVIREVEPSKPSTRVSSEKESVTLAASRQTDPKKLTAMLRGDLDCVVMKCLEKNRSRRYETANGLAADIKRHLANEPVAARPPSMAYRTQKAWQRNKLAYSAAGAVAAALLIGIAASLWQASRAREEAARAKVLEQHATNTLEELRATAPTFAEQARSLAAKEQFGDAIAKLDYAIKLRPDAAEYLVAKADLFQCQLKLREATAIYREALRLKPGDAHAEASAKLCEELLAADKDKLSRESLAKLHLAMQSQRRPTAELLPVARLLGGEKKLLLDYWMERLKDLPVSVERPLKDRLTVRDDGRLALDLSDTKVIDLYPLEGAPLAVLNVSASHDQNELSDLSPLSSLDLIDLNISRTSVEDLSPLRDMRTLEKLDMTGSKVADLSELSALRLKKLTFAGCPISDLNPIRNMPLEEMSVHSTRVADISPLIGMPIKTIDLSMAPVLDFSPLSKLPLEKCYLQRNRITDLAVLQGKPLKELVLWGCADARNFAVLSELKTLELLLLPSEIRSLPSEDYLAISALRNHPKLRQLGSQIMNQMGYGATGSKEIFWKDWDLEQTFVPALRKSGIRFSVSKLPSGFYSLYIKDQPLRDLSFLKATPISELNVISCNVTDLAPLRDMPLEYLNIPGSPITDLSPLRGKKIKTLYLTYTKVSDLSPLASLPLKDLYLGNCENVTDVAALGQISTLENVVVPIHAANIDALRKLPKLERLGYDLAGNTKSGQPYIPDTTAAEFWKEYDGNLWMGRLNDSAMKRKGLRRLADGTWSVDLTGAQTFSDLSVFKDAAISSLTLDKTGVTDLTPLRGLPLKFLSLRNTTVRDLSPLQGTPLEILALTSSRVSDLSALRGLQLKSLYLGKTEVADLEPLRGMPLSVLYLYKTKVTDLSPLRGMPLERLSFTETPVSDISPLAGSKRLAELVLPLGAKNIEFLRAFPKLKHLSFTTDLDNVHTDRPAADFWKEYDSQGWFRTLRESNIVVKSSKQLPEGTWELDFSESNLIDLTLLKGAPISKLSLNKTGVTDLGPLSGMPLVKLDMSFTKVSDLRPLQGMQLQQLEARSTNITDISALRGMPLQSLQIGSTAVSDLEPLRGMPLTHLWIFSTKVADLSPLAGMPLVHIHLSGTKVADLSALRGMPLIFLRLHDCSKLTDLSPLSDANELNSITIPRNATIIECLRTLPKLDRIGYAEDSKKNHLPDHTAAEFWEEYDKNPNKMTWVERLRASGAAAQGMKELRDHTWDVDLTGAKFNDLKILQGAPISSLNLNRTAVSDLDPLRGMPLTKLYIYDTKVSDLSPLAGMQIQFLHIGGTKVTDLSPLRGMPLKILRMHKCPDGIDLSPLKDMTSLTEFILPPKAKNFEFLRTLTGLKRISFNNDEQLNRPDKTAAEFWKEYDAQK